LKTDNKECFLKLPYRKLFSSKLIIVHIIQWRTNQWIQISYSYQVVRVVKIICSREINKIRHLIFSLPLNLGLCLFQPTEYDRTYEISLTYLAKSLISFLPIYCTYLITYLLPRCFYQIQSWMNKYMVGISLRSHKHSQSQAEVTVFHPYMC
jgi:hypothetical protein